MKNLVKHPILDIRNEAQAYLEAQNIPKPSLSSRLNTFFSNIPSFAKLIGEEPEIIIFL